MTQKGGHDILKNPKEFEPDTFIIRGERVPEYHVDWLLSEEETNVRQNKVDHKEKEYGYS